jgi:hypothetical protein
MGWNGDGTISNKASYDQDRFLFVCDAVGDCKECYFSKMGFWNTPTTPCMFKKPCVEYYQCCNPMAQLEETAPDAVKRIL